MQALLNDFTGALRQLRQSPGPALLAILTLALGIGANTAIFTVIEAVLLRPLSYTHADRLVYIGPVDRPGFGATSWLNYRDIRDQAKQFNAVAAYSEDVAVIENRDGSRSVVAPRTTANLFSMLGAQPLLGRAFTGLEAQSGGPDVVLLSEGLWRQSFQADPDIVGKAVRIGGKPHTVVGVMPSSFSFPESMGPDMHTGVWLPMRPSAEMLKDRGYHFINVVGALQPGTSIVQAQRELDAVSAHIPPSRDGQRIAFRATPYQEVVTGPVRPTLLSLLAALALVLLIACANVSNLLIARCLGRQKEFAVRAALGASRLRLVRQLLAEGLVLSLGGCGVGLILAHLAMLAMSKLPAGTIPRADSIAIHWTVLLTLAAIAMLTTLLSSLLPALLVARADPQAALQAASRGVGSRAVSRRLSGWLVAGEVALSTLLLVGTGLLFHTLWNLQQSSMGFDTAHLTTFQAMPADAAGFSEMAVSQDAGHAPASVATLAYQPVLDRIRQVPGVQSAALTTAVPLSGIDIGTSFSIAGRAKDPTKRPEARISAVSGDYARTLSTPILRGRMIDDDDVATAPFVTVINETLAKKYFPGQDPLQQQIDLGGKDTGMIKPYTIVGVLADQVDSNVGGAVQPLHSGACAAGSHHLSLLSGAIGNRGQLRSEDAWRHSRRSGDALGLSPGSPGLRAGSVSNHAAGGGEEHLQPAVGLESCGFLRRTGGGHGDCRVVRRVVPTGKLSPPRDRRPHGAGRHPEKCGATRPSPGFDPDWRRAGHRSAPVFCLGSSDQELPVPGAAVGHFDLCRRSCDALSHRIDRRTYSRSPGCAHRTHASAAHGVVLNPTCRWSHSTGRPAHPPGRPPTG